MDAPVWQVMSSELVLNDRRGIFESWTTPL